MADGQKCSSTPPAKLILDAITNDSSSLSASTSFNGESVDSDCNERCVVDSSRHETLPMSNLGDSGEDSENRTLPVQSCQILNDFTDNSEKSDGSRRKLTATTDTIRPIFSITFRNEDIARKYKKTIKEFLKDLIRKHDPESEECDASDLELDVWEESNDECIQDKNLEDSDLFTVDKRPTSNDELDVPTYIQNFSEVLQEVKEDSKEVKKNANASLQTCFNCMGNHCVRDCPKPRDGQAIAKNRREFMNKYSNVKTSRYHLDDEQRFAHFTPGEISHTLSKALGLSKHRLPKHIYRMRLLGYPPGWMEDAKVTHSGISLFDSQGQEVADPENEEGEIVTGGERDKYDMKKIISYPGFNVPSSPGTIDDYEYHGCPPMMSNQSKDMMLSQLQSSSTQAYKKRRLLPVSGVSSKPKDQTLSDMEVEDVPGTESLTMLPEDDNCRFIPPLPKETPPRPPPPPSTESDSEGGESRSQEPGSPMSTGQSSVSSPRAQSPSLSDLETRKRLLLAELEDGGSSSDTNLQRITPLTPTLGKVKSVTLGTPILKSASPFSCLPEADKFSHNICDVINFENLPDSTGKYEKINHIIHKVRTAVSRIQHENDK